MLILRLIVWAVIVGAAWLFYVFYNAWPGPWVLACAVALPPALFLLSLPSMLGLNIRFEGPGRVVRGAGAEYNIRFSNARLLPVHSVTLHLELCNLYTGDVTHESYFLRNLEASRITLSLPTGACGVICFRITRCELRDPLGLFAIRRSFEEEFRCAVLPEALKARVDLDTALDASQVLKPKYGGGFSEDYDLRDYRPGDLPGSVHWKLSSKTDKLVVKEALEVENRIIFLVLDQAGKHDEGLGVLRWLSSELLSREEPHIIVADSMYPVENEGEADAALVSLLSGPMSPPCEFDTRAARCVLRVHGSEVRVE